MCKQEVVLPCDNGGGLPFCVHEGRIPSLLLSWPLRQKTNYAPTIAFLSLRRRNPASMCILLLQVPSLASEPGSATSVVVTAGMKALGHTLALRGFLLPCGNVGAFPPRHDTNKPSSQVYLNARRCDSPG